MNIEMLDNIAFDKIFVQLYSFLQLHLSPAHKQNLYPDIDRQPALVSPSGSNASVINVIPQDRAVPLGASILAQKLAPPK